MRVLRCLSLRSLLSLFALSLFLSACGGGGGGGGGGGIGGGAGAFAVRLDRSSLSFTGEENTSIAPVVVTATASGSVPDTIYLGSLDLGTAIERATFDADGNQARFRVSPKSTLPPGVYTGTLQLFVCRDAQCATHASGSPASVQYTVTVTKVLKVTPQVLKLTASSDGTLPTANVVVQLPEGTSSFSARSSAPWLSVSDVTASGFRITAQPLPPGGYVGDVVVSVGSRSMGVSVTYEVPVGASTVGTLRPSASSLSFSAQAAGTAPEQVLSVTLPSWASAANAGIEYQSGSGWLSLRKTGAESYAVNASAGALPVGTYQASIILSAGGLSGTYPVVVPVVFTVGTASWSIDGSTHFGVSGASTAASLAGDLAIGVQNFPNQPYTASTTTPWLKLSSTSGVTGGAPLRIAVDVAEMLKLQNGKTHTGELVLSGADSRIATRRFAITLAKALPALDYVSPHTRLPGEGGVYTLRGRAFDSIADLSQALAVTGATPAQVTRVNDTELKVTLGGAASGEVRFALRNALDALTGTPVLSVVPQAAFGYAAVPSAGAKNGLVFDAERQALYSVARNAHAVLRFAWNGTAWSTTSIPLTNADSVALSPDGASLVASAAPRSIVLFDPLTLQKQAGYETVGVIAGTDGLSRLAVTNTGRAYFQGYASTRGLPYFDLVAREFGAADVGWDTNFNNGPWFSISGDGSRLNIVQSSSAAPLPPMLYLDSSNEQVRENPANIKNWHQAAQSLRGERFVEGMNSVYRVRDRDFANVGNMALPDAQYSGRTPLLSPDGARGYVLAYHLNALQGGTQLPRVYVFDTSTRPSAGADLPLLGYFDLADYPGCPTNRYGCDWSTSGAISPDGKTLFFIGDANLVVAPIPALTPSPQGVGMQRAKSAASGIVPKLTRVPLGR